MQALSVLACLMTCLSASFAQWEQTSMPYGGNVWAFGVNGTTIFAATEIAGVVRSPDEGVSWASPGSVPMNVPVRSVIVAGSDIFAATLGAGVFRSTNDGIDWSAVNTGLEGTSLRITALAFNGNYVFADEIYGLYRSEDSGQTWTSIAPGMILFCSFVSRGSILFGGVVDQIANLPPRGWIVQSTDDGAHWFRADPTQAETPVYALAVMGTDVFAGRGSGGVYRTTDDGATWVPTNSGLGNATVLSLAVSGGLIYAGTAEGGLFVSGNRGVTWSAADSGLGSAGIHALAVCGSYLFAGTVYGQVWRRLLSEMPVATDDPSFAVPSCLHLAQNYPNPFNPTTTIDYALPEGGQVRLSVFNLLGDQVTELVDEIQDAGYKTASFDASILPSGVYIYRISVRGFTASKKMVLVR